ncbi:MAG: helix-turn-helix domain-containing protein [Streptosporangiaceae bacterium]
MSDQLPSAVVGEQRPGGVLFTVEEAARRLRIGRTLAYRLMASGQLGSVKVGRLRRVPAECVAEYVASLRNDQVSRSADAGTAA